jgi:hypothetical protein
MLASHWSLRWVPSTNELYSGMWEEDVATAAGTNGGKREKLALFWPACRIRSFVLLIYLSPAAIALVRDPLASSSFSAHT